MSRISVLYLGLHPHTPQWIESSSVHVQGIGALEYFDKPGNNLANKFFKRAYTARVEGIVQRFGYAFLWSVTRFFVTDQFQRYRPHLDLKLFSKADILDASDAKALEEYIVNEEIDLLVINSWSLLPLEVIERPRHGTLNIHPSKLPKYRGSLPTLWALKNRDSESAVTFMIPAAGVDDGQIVSQYPFSISSSDTAIDIEFTVERIIRKYLRRDIVGLCHGLLIPRAQVGEASSTKRYQEYREIFWKDEVARDIYNKILLYPYLEWGLYCYWRFAGEKVVVTNAQLVRATELAAGAFRIKGGELMVGTREGSVVMRLDHDIPQSASRRLRQMGTGTFI